METSYTWQTKLVGGGKNTTNKDRYLIWLNQDGISKIQARKKLRVEVTIRVLPEEEQPEKVFVIDPQNIPYLEHEKEPTEQESDFLDRYRIALRTNSMLAQGLRQNAEGEFGRNRVAYLLKREDETKA